MASCSADGEIHDLESAALSKHLRTCSACRSFLESLSASQDSMGILPAPRPWERDRVAALARREVEAANRGTVPRRRYGVRTLWRSTGWRRKAPAYLRSPAPTRPRVGLGTLAASLLVFLLASSLFGLPGGRQAAGPQTVALALPQVTAGRTLDPSYVPYLQQDLGGGRIVVAAGTANEKLLFFQSPMSFHEEFHFRPEEL